MNGNNIFWLIVLIAAIFFSSVSQFATSIGADIGVTFDAAVYSLALLLVVIAIKFLAELRLPTASILFAALDWQLWWGVLDSISRGGKSVASFNIPSEVWYTTNYFKYGVEVGLFGLFIIVISNK